MFDIIIPCKALHWADPNNPFLKDRVHFLEEKLIKRAKLCFLVNFLLIDAFS